MYLSIFISILFQCFYSIYFNNIFVQPVLKFSFSSFIVDSLASVLISSPFDNFRIECPQTSGAQRLAIRMVESQGQKDKILYTLG
ncbi:hypothetical protein Mgra_00006347 [Meloidogyne graminicola]|uniref:Uncharacterized protein n=1 Tax=Meloidogyne graminicola TaxID=189291 RepID=A0A8S9ZLI1_9BILA|nr:hypothetical protein Mgra_00006347 [Meloidogyne graminicola]